jgi:hypothetical protein
MRVIAEFDPAIAETLALRINQVVNSDTELTHGEILVACMTAICGVIEAIDCRGCRSHAAKAVKKFLPKMMHDTIAQASAKPDGLNHHH